MKAYERLFAASAARGTPPWKTRYRVTRTLSLAAPHVTTIDVVVVLSTRKSCGAVGRARSLDAASRCVSLDPG